MCRVPPNDECAIRPSWTKDLVNFPLEIQFVGSVLCMVFRLVFLHSSFSHRNSMAVYFLFRRLISMFVEYSSGVIVIVIFSLSQMHLET